MAFVSGLGSLLGTGARSSGSVGSSVNGLRVRLRTREMASQKAMPRT